MGVEILKAYGLVRRAAATLRRRYADIRHAGRTAGALAAMLAEIPANTDPQVRPRPRPPAQRAARTRYSGRGSNLVGSRSATTNP